MDVALAALILAALGPAPDVTFRADFNAPDHRWQTRHTPTPDLPAADFAPKYTSTGKLALRLKKRGGQIHTSHVATTRTFVYGRFEARMRFNGPRGAHSAFWLQDADPDLIGGSEVDIVEHFGNAPLWHNVLYRTPDTMWPKSPTAWQRTTSKVDRRDWHVYAVDWRRDAYTFYIDGREVGRSTRGLSDHPKVLILSMLSSEWEWPRLDRDRLWRYRTTVDWVRVTP